jgi:pSer/pThr/pTyr-binding forkhead associated (FHA) protein
MPKLILQPTGAPAVPHELSEELVTIGRSPDNVIQIDDPSVSGRHAQLHQVGEAFHLQDLESTNGTRVNGEVITSVALKVGDRIRFGKVEASFDSDVPSAAQPLPALVETEARPAEISVRPADFGNASPFPKRRSEKDAARTAIFAAAAVAILAFIASMLSLAQMRPPTL